MAEIKINDTYYPIKFGMKFIKEVNKRESVPIEGMPSVKQNVGVRWMIAEIMDGSTEALADALLTGNKTEDPKLNTQIIEDFIDNPETDIDDVFDQVLGFFESSNCTKRLYREIKDSIAVRKAQMESQ